MAAKRTFSLIVVILALLGGVTWLVLGLGRTPSGEATLDIALLCSGCGHSMEVDFEGLARVMSEGAAKGIANTGSREGPVGICPKCGRPRLYRAEEDPQTGKPVLPAEVTPEQAPATNDTPR